MSKNNIFKYNEKEFHSIPHIAARDKENDRLVKNALIFLRKDLIKSCVDKIWNKLDRMNDELLDTASYDKIKESLNNITSVLNALKKKWPPSI